MNSQRSVFYCPQIDGLLVFTFVYLYFHGYLTWPELICSRVVTVAEVCPGEKRCRSSGGAQTRAGSNGQTRPVPLRDEQVFWFWQLSSLNVTGVGRVTASLRLLHQTADMLTNNGHCFHFSHSRWNNTCFSAQQETKGCLCESPFFWLVNNSDSCYSNDECLRCSLVDTNPLGLKDGWKLN